MAILAIDPGTKTGGALFLVDGAPVIFTLTKPDMFAIVRVVKWAKAMARVPKRIDDEGNVIEWSEPGSALELVTEDQHLGRGSKANPATTLSIARAAERWIAVAELFGLRTIQVQPATWREPLLGSIPKRDSITGATLDKKARTKLLVQRLWAELELHKGEPASTPSKRVNTTRGKLPGDPIDAVGLGYWRLIKGSARPRERAPKKRNRTRAAKVSAA